MTDLVPKPKGHPIKLVRDQTPAVVNSSGEPGGLFYQQLAPHERKHWLRLKLGEEVTEYLLSGGYDELADVLAVLEALAIEHGGSLGGLRAVNDCDKRGGFHDGVMMYGHHPEFDG